MTPLLIGTQAKQKRFTDSLKLDSPGVRWARRRRLRRPTWERRRPVRPRCPGSRRPSAAGPRRRPLPPPSYTSTTRYMVTRLQLFSCRVHWSQWFARLCPHFNFDFSMSEIRQKSAVYSHWDRSEEERGGGSGVQYQYAQIKLLYARWTGAFTGKIHYISICSICTYSMLIRSSVGTGISGNLAPNDYLLENILKVRELLCANFDNLKADSAQPMFNTIWGIISNVVRDFL